MAEVNCTPGPCPSGTQPEVAALHRGRRYQSGGWPSVPQCTAPSGQRQRRTTAALRRSPLDAPSLPPPYLPPRTRWRPRAACRSRARCCGCAPSRPAAAPSVSCWRWRKRWVLLMLLLLPSLPPAQHLSVHQAPLHGTAACRWRCPLLPATAAARFRSCLPVLWSHAGSCTSC